MSGLIPMPPIDGITTQIQRQFVKPLRRPLTGFRLFAGRDLRSEDWTVEEYKWFEQGEMQNVVVSMDLPPVQSDSMTLSKKSIGIPLLTKDLTMGGRKAAQVKKAGLDPIFTEAAARAMAVEMERALMVGYPAKSGGPETGLLNDAASPAPVALGAWTTAETINDGLALLIEDAVANNEQSGPWALVVPRAEVALYQKFIASTNVRIGDNLPGNLLGSLGGIQAILPSTYVDAGEVKLIDTTEGNYYGLSPADTDGLRFGLGTVTTGEIARSTMLTDTDPIMLSRTFRNLNAIVPMLVRPESVATGTHT